MNSLASCLTGLSLLSHSDSYLQCKEKTRDNQINFATFWATPTKRFGIWGSLGELRQSFCLVFLYLLYVASL